MTVARKPKAPRKHADQKTIKWSFTVSPETHRIAGELAVLDDMPVSAILRRLLRKYAEERGVIARPQPLTGAVE